MGGGPEGRRPGPRRTGPPDALETPGSGERVEDRELRRVTRALVLAGVLGGVVGVPGLAGAATGVTSYGAAPTRALGAGAWSWFENPRAIVTGGGCEVLASAAAGPFPTGWVNVE